jgi:DNA processing protein
MEDAITVREISCWLALARGPAVPPSLLAMLAVEPGTITTWFDDPRAAGLTDADTALRLYLAAPDWVGVESDLRWLDAGDGTVLTFADPRFPDLLRNIPDPPPVLYLRGQAPALRLLQLAVVGSRNPSPDGVRLARQFADELARLGIGVTSGLALGIDTQAHVAALDAGGVTIAVQGCGPDQVYPRRNSRLAQRIAEQGAVLTEFGVGMPPLAANFPRRNRIISGLSLGTLVVEAARRSGSLITAALAANQGREVFAIPGSIKNPLAHGCHHLIKQGAKLATSVDDILEEIRELAGLKEVTSKALTDGHADARGLDERCRLLLDNIGFGPVAMDELVDQTGLAAGITASLLSSLEISGHIEILPGGRIVRR